MFPIIRLSGSPYDRGYIYGQQARDLVAHSIETYRHLFENKYRIEWEQLCLLSRSLLPPVAAYNEDIIDELRGLADGSGYSLDEIMVLNARTELRGFVLHKTQEKSKECTVIGAAGHSTSNNRHILAQTWDWYSTQRDACVVLQVQLESGFQFTTFTEAGMLAKVGLNNKGIGICLNIMNGSVERIEPAIPLHLALRSILEMTDIDKIISFIKLHSPKVFSCISIMDDNGIGVSIELTPYAYSVVKMDKSILVHTNHVTDKSLLTNQNDEFIYDSKKRYNRAKDLLLRNRGYITEDVIMNVLGDHHNSPECICFHPDVNLDDKNRCESVCAIIMDLVARKMSVSSGLPCKAFFNTIVVL